MSDIHFKSLPKVLYEDNHLIAVEKPAGMLVQGDETGDICLIDMVKQYLKEKYNKPGQVFLGLLHRLDRPVSGVILFAKTSKGASRLSEQFRLHQTKKIYQALVEGVPKKSQSILIHYVKKDPAKNKVTVYSNPTGDAQYAELSYVVLKSNEKNALLEIQLKTGRPHQIRAQLSTIGCPIVGDLKYGASKPLPDKSLRLCAISLEFKPATKDEKVKVEIETPENWELKK